MKKETLHKILSDPNFDPSSILEEAIVSFVSKNPERLAEDEVVYKYLIRDPSLASQMQKTVDINNIENLKVFLHTASKADHWVANSVKASFINKLDNVVDENIDAIFELVVTRKIDVTSNPSGMRSFGRKLSDDQLDRLLRVAKTADRVRTWNAEAWDAFLTTSFGIDTFIECLKKGNIIPRPYDGSNFFRKMSEIIKAEGSSPRSMEILNWCKSEYDSHICFKCGRGCELDASGNHRESNVIKSLSGYTLHRQKCDPENEYPSPWEILFNEVRTFEYPCKFCGEVFTTTSGRTLHENKCRHT
jgi:hypothetical protein